MNRKLEESLVKSYDEVLSLKEKAEGANRLKSSFLAAMSHDIRTPLNAIMGFTDLLLKKERRDQPQNTLKKISAAGEGLLKLIDDILDFSKIEAGQMDIHKQPFSLKESMDNLLVIFEHQYKEKGLGFRVNLTTSIPPLVCNDQWRLNQVLSNLLTNALKFTDSGEVSLYCSYRKSQDLIVFRVSDTGIGIPPHHMELIFDAFSQISHQDSQTQKGTGLGLTICKKLTHLMGGNITVHSTPGEGTVFNLEIPANSDDIKQEEIRIKKEPKMEEDLALKKGNLILVVEDNPVNLELLLEQLGEAGFKRVEVAVNGREAIDIAIDKQPALVLMDLQMPVMGGLEAIVKLKELGFEKPIIALSAFAMQDDIEKTLNSGAAGYITKPIDFKTFFNRIGNFLSPAAKKGASETSENRVKPDTKETPGEQKSSQEGDEEYILKGNVSERLKNLFRTELKKKLETLHAIVEAGDYKDKIDTIKSVAHGYRGNAAIFGLSILASTAAKVDGAVKEGKSVEELIPLTHDLVAVLERINRLNN